MVESGRLRGVCRNQSFAKLRICFLFSQVLEFARKMARLSNLPRAESTGKSGSRESHRKRPSRSSDTRISPLSLESPSRSSQFCCHAQYYTQIVCSTSLRSISPPLPFSLQDRFRPLPNFLFPFPNPILPFFPFRYPNHFETPTFLQFPPISLLLSLLLLPRSHFQYFSQSQFPSNFQNPPSVSSEIKIEG